MIKEILAFCGPYQAANIKTIRGRNGDGFECVLLKGERVIGTPTEWANGGPIQLDVPAPMDLQDLLAHAKTKHPTVKYEAEGVFVGVLAGYWELIKRLKARAKKHILVSDPTDMRDVDEYGVNLVYIDIPVDDTAENRAKVKAKYPHGVVLNEALDAINFGSPFLP